MASPHPQQAFSRGVTIAISIVALAVVWSVVWANMPTLKEIQAAQAAMSVAEAAPLSPAFDPTIPGVPPVDGKKTKVSSSTVVVNGAEGPKARTELSESSAALDSRARQILEMKCDAEVEQICPQSMSGEERRQCMEQRITHLPRPCQQILRQRFVQWKERSGHALACVEDVKRFCPEAQAGEGRVLQCLQRHAQKVSDQCYATLPKGSLTYRN